MLINDKRQLKQNVEQMSF